MKIQDFLKEYSSITVGAIIGISIILSVFLLTNGIVKYQKLQNQTITTTGSASKEIKADKAIVSIGYKTQAKTLKEGYKRMEADKEKLTKFLIEAQFDPNNIECEQISNYEVYKREGAFSSNEIDYYRFNSAIKVSVSKIEMVENIKKQLNSFVINDNIDIAYTNIEYLVSSLDEIKIEMVGRATKNAKERANSMVAATGGKIGVLTSAKMGVFQIVPAESTDVSDSGINDTTSPNKKIVAVVSATFNVK